MHPGVVADRPRPPTRPGSARPVSFRETAAEAGSRRTPRTGHSPAAYSQSASRAPPRKVPAGARSHAVGPSWVQEPSSHQFSDRQTTPPSRNLAGVLSLALPLQAGLSWKPESRQETGREQVDRTWITPRRIMSKRITELTAIPCIMIDARWSGQKQRPDQTGGLAEILEHLPGGRSEKDRVGAGH